MRILKWEVEQYVVRFNALPFKDAHFQLKFQKKKYFEHFELNKIRSGIQQWVKFQLKMRILKWEVEQYVVRFNAG
jgi:hypothetical protein